MENIPSATFTPTFKTGDRIWRATGEKLAIRIVLVDATESSNKIADAHKANGFARQLLGESAAGALLLASGLKGPGTVQLRFSLSGDFSRLAADATPLGLVRAMIPQDELHNTGSFEPLMMPQILTVRKLDPSGQRIAEGIVEMESSDISTSLTHYLRQSEQGKALLRVTAVCDTPEGGNLGFCGGILLESFPGLSENDWIMIEKTASALDFTSFVRSEGGFDLLSMFAALVGSIPAQVHQEFKVESYCPCSEDGVLRALTGLGRAELESLFLEGNDVEVFCEFCRKRYVVEPEKIMKLLNEVEEQEGGVE